MQTGSSGTLIGWKSGQTTNVPLWDRNGGSVAMDSGAGMGARTRDSNWRPAYCLARLPFTHTHTPPYDMITVFH